MKKSILSITCANLAISGFISFQIDKSNDDVSFDPIPAVLIEDSKHPVKIHTEYGVFVKTSGQRQFNQEEIAKDYHSITAKTKMIVNEYLDLYVKNETTQ